jgi:hypothetical protein
MEEFTVTDEVLRKLEQIAYDQAMGWYAGKDRSELGELYMNEQQTTAVSEGRIRALKELLTKS